MNLPSSVMGAMRAAGLSPSIRGFSDEATVAPTTAEQAAAVLAAAAAENLSVGFRGAGTRHEVGGTRTYAIGMLSSRMAEVIDWPVEDLTIVVGSGMTVDQLEPMLNAKGQTSLLPTGDPHRTVGGIVAEGESGYGRLKHGPTRDRVLEVTLATGYGKVVRGGGRLVKNVTGYDLPRLVTGSLGSLGFIASVCLKLWPLPQQRSIARVDDAAAAYEQLYRPFAVVEPDTGSYVVLEGSGEDISVQASSIGARIDDGAVLPPVIGEPILISIRVPPARLSEARRLVIDRQPDRFIAQHGVGIIDAGWSKLALNQFVELRKDIERLGGSAVVLRSSGLLPGVDPWGTAPPTMAIQRRLKQLFDPSGICNPGKLPGGL
ncbi:MAG: FAD-binding oxidoreductase [Acidimicrobiia bacterium]|nr:FAD-binding oxidoreductase [Acidimicrobiia bacterium]